MGWRRMLFLLSIMASMANLQGLIILPIINKAITVYYLDLTNSPTDSFLCEEPRAESLARALEWSWASCMFPNFPLSLFSADSYIREIRWSKPAGAGQEPSVRCSASEETSLEIHYWPTRVPAYLPATAGRTIYMYLTYQPCGILSLLSRAPPCFLNPL